MGIQVAFPTLVLSVQPRGVEGSPYWLSLEIQSPYPFPQSGETERGLWGICWQLNNLYESRAVSRSGRKSWRSP